MLTDVKEYNDATMDTGDTIGDNNDRPTPISAHNHSPAESKKTGWRAVREWLQVILIALVISLPIRFFIAEPFIVNGASMDPTFSTGQFLIVDRLSYRFEAPKRDDVIIFQYPGNPSIYYIKRIIGLPGETIHITDGMVSIAAAAAQKSVTLREPYVDPVHASHDSETVSLGPTQYFVMGDNRRESSDSRSWGPLDAHFIIGRPIVRLFPLSAIGVFPGSYTSSTTNTN